MQKWSSKSLSFTDISFKARQQSSLFPFRPPKTPLCMQGGPRPTNGVLLSQECILTASHASGGYKPPEEQQQQGGGGRWGGHGQNKVCVGVGGGGLGGGRSVEEGVGVYWEEGCGDWEEECLGEKKCKL